MTNDPKGPDAARWRKRKFDLARRFTIPEDLLAGSLTRSVTRCGKPSCHCADGDGHTAWTLTFMSHGQRRTERIPKEWAEEVQRRVAKGREFHDAVREIMTANAELLVLAKKQRRKRHQ
jgi:hypothetical protein